GYVQIDTINVIERCHHHILFNRIPNYKKSDLEKAQSKDKTVFEYWTHALSYVPTSKFRYFVSRMNNVNTKKGSWFGSVSKEDYKKVMRLLEEGPLSVRDIKDDNLKEKEHEWDSRKPSKRALQLGFHRGDIVVAKREGMLKIYDLASRHFGWENKPEAVIENEYFNYLIDRSLQSQGIVSLDSICHLYPSLKKNIEPVIEQRMKENLLVPVQLEDHSKVSLWLRPEALEKKPKASELTHILSPFDPLIIQRKKLKMFFDYDHVFEAYVTPSKRKFGYFTLPVLSENRIIALLDLKTDRQNQKLLIQSWHWLNSEKTKNNKKIIEEKLESFEKFQLG
ncbi:MAG: DNA glycosylase AlkZ-like family protein, partial [Pseudobdellovibrio sp.]